MMMTPSGGPRKGAGRKKGSGKGRKDKNLLFVYLPDEVFRKFNQICETTGKTKKEIVIRLIQDFKI